jgi:hypothetical protein
VLVGSACVGGGLCTSASSAAMYFTSPSSETLRFTSSVNATGEKTASAPDCRRTRGLLVYGDGDTAIWYIPIVPRPPTAILPNLQKGTESVVRVLGTISRMTMTLAGSEGTSFEDMAALSNC